MPEVEKVIMVFGLQVLLLNLQVEVDVAAALYMDVVDAAAGHAVLGLPRLGPLRAGDEGRRVGDPPQGGRGDAQRPHGAQRRRGNASPCHQGGDAVPEDVVVVRIVSVCVHLVPKT